MTEFERRTWRAALHAGSLLTFDELLEALGVSAAAIRERVTPAQTLGDVAWYVWGDVLRVLGIALPTGGSSPELRPWLDLDDVAELLGVNVRTVTRRMQVTPAAARAWVNHGSEKRPKYRFRPDAVQQWWEKSQWPVTGKEATGTRSGGETRTAPNETAPSRRPRPRGSSSGRSKKRSDSAEPGSLKERCSDLLR